MDATMDCLLLEEWGGELHSVERPIPQPGPGDVLVEVEATSIGLTVAHAIDGGVRADAASLPVVPGHELVGTVVETGDSVTRPAEGTRVGAYFYLSCDRCDACYAGRESRCENLGGLVGIDTDGGYAEYVRLPARNAIALPQGIDPVDATVVPDAVATPVHVCTDRANVESGDEVMILGAGGGVGIHLQQVAQHFGAAVTAVDRVESKLRRCTVLDAVQVINTDRTRLEEVDGPADGYDAVVDLTGSAELIESAVELLAPGGTFVNLAAVSGHRISVSPQHLVRSETAVVGSRYCSKREYRTAARLVAEGVVEPVISEVVGLDDVPDVLATLRDGQLLGRAAVTL